MKTLTLYEQIGIVIPGAILLAAIAALAPAAKSYLRADGLTLGDFGLFLVLSYATGHVVAAAGNLLEWIIWKAFRGMPTMWVTHDPPTRLLTDDQRNALRVRITERFGYECPPLRGLPRERWKPIFAQLYADVLARGAPRVETFNGLYGLNRGLAGAMLGVIITAAVVGSPHVIPIALTAGALALVFAYRMYRFSVRFATELYVTFLNPVRPQTPAPAQTN